MSTEVERKFLVTDPPDPAMLGPGVRLRQGYIAEDGDVQVRVRISAEGATLTIKAGRGLARTEVEVAIPTEEAEDLWPHTRGRRLEKVRHRVALGAVVTDLDVYGGSLQGLCTAEVEFASEEDARSFVPPPWFGRDLTEEPGWDNASLARAGAPTRR